MSNICCNYPLCSRLRKDISETHNTVILGDIYINLNSAYIKTVFLSTDKSRVHSVFSLQSFHAGFTFVEGTLFALEVIPLIATTGQMLFANK